MPGDDAARTAKREAATAALRHVRLAAEKAGARLIGARSRAEVVRFDLPQENRKCVPMPVPPSLPGSGFCISAPTVPVFPLPFPSFPLLPPSARYALYQPLHDMWQSYIRTQLQLNAEAQVLQLQQRLVKADFHGAHLCGEHGRRAASA